MTWFIRLFFPGFATTPEEACAPSPQDLPTVPPEPPLSDSEVRARSTIRTLVERISTADELQVGDDGDVTATWKPVAGDRTYQRVVLSIWKIRTRIRISTPDRTNEISVPTALMPDVEAVRVAIFEKSRREICDAVLKATEPQ